MKRKEQGFTLIELIIVIVILGILAVTAAPKFLDLSRDARISTLQGMEAALKGGMGLVYAKAEIGNQTSGDGSVTSNGVTILTHSGYPTANWVNSVRYIIDLDDQNFTAAGTVCPTEWCGLGNQSSSPGGSSVNSPGSLAKVYPRGYTFNQECGVVYINRHDGNRPEVVLETDDC